MFDDSSDPFKTENGHHSINLTGDVVHLSLFKHKTGSLLKGCIYIYLGLFSKTCVFGARKCCFSVLVDERIKRRKNQFVFKNIRVDVDRS